MTEHIPLEQQPRDRFLEAVRKELAAFERREREFREKERKERAVQLHRTSLSSSFRRNP